MRSLRVSSPPVAFALVAVAALLVLGAGWLAVVAPQRSAAAKAAKRTEQAQAQIASLRASAAAAHAPAPTQPAIHTSQLYRLAKAMPASEDQPDLLLELSQVARASGVTLLTVTPGPATVATGYSTLPITLDVNGDYYSLTDMLYRLRSLVAVRHGVVDANGRLFSISSVALTPTGDGKQLDAKLTVNAYVYGAVAGAPTTAATTAASTSTTGSTSTSTSTTTTAGATTTGASG